MEHRSSVYLALADWRRAVARLYIEVRALAASDPVAALAHWRAVRECLYREHPQSPLPADERATFTARHFDHDPALRFQVPVVPDTRLEAASPRRSANDEGIGAAVEPVEGLSVTIPTSSGGTMSFQRIGWVDIPFSGGARRLALFWIEGYGGGLFLPFRDATSGRETYGGGRYLLDAAKSADLGGDAARGTLVLDFNFAYQPSCAFDPRWTCPLTPLENRLDLEIRAGERIA